MPSLKNQNPETPEKQKIKNKIKQKIITMRDGKIREEKLENS